MIPRIAHFHWTGRPMGWMRWASIQSFHRLNPDWEIRLFTTPQEVKAWGLGSPAHQGDCSRWRALYLHGGFSVDSDIIFIHPIPDAWLENELVASTGPTGEMYHMAMIGAEKGHPYMRACAREAKVCATQTNNRSYQQFGMRLLRNVRERHRGAQMLLLPEHTLCPISWYDHHKLWETDCIELPTGTIGIHWYGGGNDGEWSASPGDPAYIVREASAVHRAVVRNGKEYSACRMP